jgi:hypothetical protein
MSQLGKMIGLIMQYFGPNKFSLWHLFKDEKRKALNLIMEKSMRQVENSFRKIYNRDYTLMNFLKTDDIPLPTAYTTTLQYVLNSDLRNALMAEKIDLLEMRRIKEEFKKWDLTIDDSLYIEQHASTLAYEALKRVRNEYEDTSRLERLNGYFEYLNEFGLEPNHYKTQNLYFEMSIDEKLISKTSEEWKSLFRSLGEKLGIKTGQESLV